MKENQISGLLITGLLALLGTVAGGVIQGYWDSQLAEKDFQSKLILRALEPDDVNERVKSLQFLVDAKLITDRDVEEGLRAIIAEGEDSIPQFQSNIALPQNNLSGNNFSSVKPSDLQNNIAPLVALRVRYGDVIDSVTPIFAILAPDLSIESTVVGDRFGGAGGGETILEKEGYIITGIDFYTGYYFGDQTLVKLKVIWHKLTPLGIDPTDQLESEILGSANLAEEVQLHELRADPGNYIDDFSLTTATHSDGSTFLQEITITQKKLPTGS